MRKLLGLTLILGIVQAVAGAAVSLWILRKVDLRFQAFLALAVIPLFQAVILLWVRRDAACRPMLEALRSLRRPGVLTLFVADVALLAVALMLSPELARGIFAAHALIAAIALLMAMRFVPGPRQWLVALAAVGLAAYGVSFLANWVALVPSLVHDGRTIVRWSTAYIPLFVIAVLVMLAASWALERRVTRAAGWLDIGTALFVVAAIVVGSNIFFHPSLTPAWRVVHRVLAYTTVTSMLLGAVTVMTTARGEGNTRPGQADAS